MATCYRHPNRETGVSCSNCGKPICPDCMTATPVGMRCPDCSRQKTQVHSMRTIAVDPIVTYVLIALNVLIYFGISQSHSVNADGLTWTDRLSIWGPAIHYNHEYYRLLTGAFLHASILHIATNMYVLWWLGRELEPSLGHVRFTALYFASLLCGSLGALLLTPHGQTVGASGAIFGLFGATFMIGRARGIDMVRNGIVPIILINLVFSFTLSNISIGGHIGGLIGGGICGWAMEHLAQRRLNPLVYGVAVCVVIGVIAVAASVIYANSITVQFPTG
jgi:membrane associated rhomboid family serine protease